MTVTVATMLSDAQADVATVLRESRLTIVPASDLVPGDIVEVTGQYLALEQGSDSVSTGTGHYNRPLAACRVHASGSQS